MFSESEFANSNGGKLFVPWAQINGVNLDDREDWEPWLKCFFAGWKACQDHCNRFANNFPADASSEEWD